MGLLEACGASALLLPRRTARAFQRLTDLHDDGAATSAALQAGGLVRHSRVSDESQHCCGKRAKLSLFSGQRGYYSRDELTYTLHQENNI